MEQLERSTCVVVAHRAIWIARARMVDFDVDQRISLRMLVEIDACAERTVLLEAAGLVAERVQGFESEAAPDRARILDGVAVAEVAFDIVVAADTDAKAWTHGLWFDTIQVIPQHVVLSTESNFPVRRTRQPDKRLPPEHPAALPQFAAVAIEAVLQDSDSGQTAAQIFGQSESQAIVLIGSANHCPVAVPALIADITEPVRDDSV